MDTYIATSEDGSLNLTTIVFDQDDDGLSSNIHPNATKSPGPGNNRGSDPTRQSSKRRSSARQLMHGHSRSSSSPGPSFSVSSCHGAIARSHKARRQFAAGFFCCAVIILSLVIFALVAKNRSDKDMFPWCASPADTTLVTKSMVYRISSEHWQPASYALYFGLAGGLQGKAKSAVDILFQSGSAGSAKGDSPCEWVWLNADPERITDLEFTASTYSGESFLVDTTVRHPDISDVIGIQLPKGVLDAMSQDKKGGQNKIVVSATYSLDIQPGLDGLYLSKWIDKEGQSHNLLASQMEATSARKVFPCVDQPDAKATFFVSVGCQSCDDYALLSNMPAANAVNSQSSAVPPAWASTVAKNAESYAASSLSPRVTKFVESPRMSTYLLALVVGELEFTETSIDYRGSPTKIRCYTTRGSKERGEYALGAAAKALKLYQNQFSIGFPLPKVDMVAVPDFAAGAMENWGLVTYRETALLVDHKLSSSSDKQRVAVVVAHELAHQWFGNLVTMEWWNDLWLNEGFATYTEYQGTQAIDPSFGIWDQFLWSVTTPALKLDGTRSATHRLHQDASVVQTTGEIEELFDTIDYSKGGAVIRMIATTLDLTESSLFSSAVERYLRHHTYENARASDLWDSIAAVTRNNDWPKQLDTWSNQEGYPVVTASVKSKDGGISLSQRRFFNFQQGPESSNSKEEWWIPITYCVFSKPGQGSTKLGTDAQDCFNRIKDERQAVNTCDLVPNDWSSQNAESTKSCNIQMDVHGSETCIKINIGQLGFYRVSYSRSNWKCLLDSFRALPNDDRAGIVDDVFAVAYSPAPTSEPSDLTDYEIPLSFASQLTDETSFVVWSPALSHLSKILRLLGGQNVDCVKSSRDFLFSVINKQVTQLGLLHKSSDTHLTRMLRSKILSTAVVFGHDDTVANAKSIFANASQMSSLEPDEQRTVLTAVVRWGSESDFYKVKDKYLAARFAAEKSRIMMALAATRSPKLIDEVLSLSISKEVRAQDTVQVIASVARFDEGRSRAFEFVKQNWNLLYDRYGEGGFALTRLVLTASHFYSEDKLKDVSQFFDEHDVPAARRAVLQTKEEIKGAVTWVNDHAASVCSWFEERSKISVT